MTSPIQLESVSKCYRIYQNPQDRFKQALLERFMSATGRENTHALYREHWALRDISFELKAGEAVGILGRNGAGKSTLLQIIAGTLQPTSGVVNTHGRITALLELGSGFNPEFTGRENVLLNAQILGLSREEALARFDEIASFADIGDFIDQPVKTYSSGMMMRLAFSVQTAIEPKVLIVDEALSVGDMFFQSKCMSRIRKLADEGVAILFVSHDVATVRQLCNRAILLSDGKISAFGETCSVADQYVKRQLEDRNRLADSKNTSSHVLHTIESFVNSTAEDVDTLSLENSDMDSGKELFEQKAAVGRSGNHFAKVSNVQLLKNGLNCSEFSFDDEAGIKIFVSFMKEINNLNLAFKIRTIQGTDIVFQDTRIQGLRGKRYLANKTYLFSWKLKLPLMHGNYAISIGLACPPVMPEDDWLFVDVIPHACDFQMMARENGMIGGFVVLPAELNVSSLNS